MIVQTIHEILNPFDVHEQKHGYGVALFMIAGSIHSNPQFIVRFYETGILRTVDQNDIKVFGNPTAGEPLTPKNLDAEKKLELAKIDVLVKFAKRFRDWQADWDRFAKNPDREKLQKPISFDELMRQLLEEK